MRLFIAIDLKPISDYIKNLQSNIDMSVGRISLTKTYHLTLKFLGDIPEAKLPAIRDSLTKVSFPEFNLYTDDIGFFPSERKIKVVWLGIEASPELAKLAKDIDRGTEHIVSSDKPFKAHITLARVKFLDNSSGLKPLKDMKKQRKTLKIDAFSLIRSTLTPEGPIYEVIETYKSNTIPL